LKNGSDYKLTWYVEASNKKIGYCTTKISLASKVNYDINVKITDEQ
jgi:hypothetical protein